MAQARQTNVGAMLERHWGCLPAIVAVVVVIASSHWAFRLSQYLYINAAYGRSAWEGGLRVVDNKGNLSDGGKLSRVGHLVVYPGSFFLTVPVFLACGFGGPYVMMRLRGERLGEQLSRWEKVNGEERARGERAP